VFIDIEFVALDHLLARSVPSDAEGVAPFRASSDVDVMVLAHAVDNPGKPELHL